MFYPFSSGQEDIVKDGLVLWLDAGDRTSYPGGGTVWRDLTPNQYQLNLINGPVFSNDTFFLSGTDDEISTDNFIAFNNNPWSICGWLYYESVVGNQGLVWGSSPLGGDRLFSGPNVETQWGPIDSFYVDLLWSGVSHRITTGNSIMRRNDWNFVSFTYSAGSIKIYLDGVERASQLINPTNENFWINARIQIGRTTTTNAYIGGISTTQIYNRALSANEISQNFNSTRTRFGV